MKLGGWLLITAVLVGMVWGAAKLGLLDKILPGLTTTASQDMEKTTIQKVTVDDKYTGSIDVQMPGTDFFTNTQPVRGRVAAWNAQQGMLFANGDSTTTVGSAMAKENISLTLERNDDYGQMQLGLMTHAQGCASGQWFNNGGVTYVFFMGDNAAGFLEAINPKLEKQYGPNFIAEVDGIAGFSYGEDKWLGPPEWKLNPQSARGGLTIVVRADGDFNLPLVWGRDNNIPLNPDGTTYDPDALNFYWANTFTQAAQLFIAGVEEERPVVKNGKRTGETRKVKAQGVSTWTPGDQQAVDQKGGVVTICDTKDYAGQMPCVMVGIKAFNERFPNIPTGILKAIDYGSKAVRSSDQARWRAAEVSARLYRENDAEYWYKYFDGEIRNVSINGQNYVVSLGGSRVCTLSDMLLYFGLGQQNARNVYKDVYEYFGRQYVKLFPDVITKFPAFDQIMNTTYMLRAQQETGAKPSQTFTKFQQGSEVTQVVGQKSWNIEFEFGSAQLSPKAVVTLEQIASELSSNYELKVVFSGHTDSIGAEINNLNLSEARARAVRDWLYTKYPVNFPLDRMDARGYGETRPLADNGTPQGRAINRRVEIKTGR